MKNTNILRAAIPATIFWNMMTSFMCTQAYHYSQLVDDEVDPVSHNRLEMEYFKLINVDNSGVRDLF